MTGARHLEKSHLRDLMTDVLEGERKRSNTNPKDDHRT